MVSCLTSPPPFNSSRKKRGRKKNSIFGKKEKAKEGKQTRQRHKANSRILISKERDENDNSPIDVI